MVDLTTITTPRADRPGDELREAQGVQAGPTVGAWLGEPMSHRVYPSRSLYHLPHSLATLGRSGIRRGMGVIYYPSPTNTQKNKTIV